MTQRLLATAISLLVGLAAQAQQADSLAAAPDSIASRLRAGTLPPFPTIQPALSRVAGAQVTPYSGAPGAWSTVRIRGVANVTGSRQPLYVVDGVPAYNTDVTPEEWSSAADFFNRSQPFSTPISTPHTPAANPLLDLPVEDVAQVEVLKGAAATARYGMQGTNGVILITTRSGAEGAGPSQPLRVRYAGWGGVQQVRQRYELLGARQYANLANVAALNSGQPAPYPATSLASLREVDWQDQVLQTAGSQSHHLSLDGLRHRTRYYVAADYLRQTGVVKESGLSRYHLRANLDQQLTAKLSVGLKASGSQTDQFYGGRDPQATSLLRTALFAPPAGRPAAAGAGSGFYPFDPLFELYSFGGAPRTRRLLAQLRATYRFTDELRLSVRGSREQVEVRELDHSPSFDPSAPLGSPPVVAETGTATISAHNSVLDATLSYQHTFGGQHALTGSLSYLRQQFERTLTQHSYSGFGGFRAESGYQISWQSNHIHSPSAQVGYTYAGRYEVQASLRTDFALSPDNSEGQYYWFPGAELSWHLQKEAFLAGVSSLSDLTLWAGTGRTSSYFSPDRTSQQDAGLRLAAFGGRLRLEAALYQRRTRHAQTLLALPVAFTNPREVVYFEPDVSLLNQGVELTLGSTWRVGPLAGTSQLAAATNRNQVEDITTPFTYLISSHGLEAGQPVGGFYSFQQEGTYPAGSPNAGQIHYRDFNGDGRLDYQDTPYQSSSLPRYTLNFYQQVRLRRFELEAQLDGLFGYQLLNTTLAILDTPTGQTNSSVRAQDYWSPDHQDTFIPKAGAYPPYRTSDRNLASGDHLRLSQLTLSYDMLRAGARRASVWVGGQNLLVTGSYRGYDPNVSSGGAAPLQAGEDASVYPVARVWQVGVRGQF